MRRSYDKRVNPHCFEVGDIVLQENQKNLMEHEKPRKFDPNWLGPFVITKVVGNDAYHLQMMKGDPLPYPINNMHLKIH